MFSVCRRSEVVVTKSCCPCEITLLARSKINDRIVTYSTLVTPCEVFYNYLVPLVLFCGMSNPAHLPGGGSSRFSRKPSTSLRFRLLIMSFKMRSAICCRPKGRTTSLSLKRRRLDYEVLMSERPTGQTRKVTVSFIMDGGRSGDSLSLCDVI